MYVDDGSPLEKYEKALVNLAQHSEKFSYSFSSDKQDRWVVPTMDDGEAWEILRALHDDHYVVMFDPDRRLNTPPALLGWKARMSPKGFQRASELHRPATGKENIVFIAACFAPELSEACNTIKDVLEELGYKPILVKDVPHNDIIDMQIYEGIRQSKFIVADLTCNRQSVYYEAGFAHGLDLEVVLTCRKDCHKDYTDEYKHVHFDLDHRNILVWEAVEELKKELRAHIYQCFGAAT